ncbi:hypothetical protein J3F83DRAFT_745218 [Trichoderma novae-zelandiae]
MAGPAQGEQVEGGCFAVLSSYLTKRRSKKPDGRQDSRGSVPKAEASPPRSAVSSIPTATSQEASGATNAKSIGSRTGLIQERVERGQEQTDDADLWSRAYRKLDGKTRQWIGDAAKNDGGEERTQDLVTLVRQREEEYKDETPKLRVGGYEIMWRDYANRVVMWVTTIGDISMGFAPAPSAVVWSALKVLLKANVSQCEDLAAIFGCAEEVLRLIRHGRVYEDVYLSGDSCSAATQNLQDALVGLYKSLMELLAHAFTRLSEGQGRQFLRALVSGGQGAKLVSALAEQERKVSIAAQGCGAIASQEHQQLLKSLDEPLRNVEDTVRKLVEKIDHGELEQALEYISNIPIGEHQQEKHDSRTPTTCEWLLDCSKFLEWEESDCSSTLWLQGKVGAGKSFLTSKVIDHLTTRQQEAEYDEGFAYFYCSRSDPVRRETKYVLRSYISQLARVPNNPTMMEKNIYMLYLKARKEKRGFSTAECETALIELVNFYPRTTFILDALDECEMDTREALSRILRNLVDKGQGTVKVFIASRKEADIEAYLGSQKLVAISTTDNKNDIDKYIEEEVARVGVAWSSVSAEVKGLVKQTIGEKSDGMFRWAYLQWEQLKQLRTNERIRERLGKLPQSLTEAYDEIYSKNEEKAVLERAVKWVLCARKPLTSDVLLMAVRLESRIQTLGPSDSIDESTFESSLQSLTLSDPIDESTLESICAHLVVLDSQLKVWKFPHASVAEYFENQHKSLIDKAPEDVAILLVSCLIDCYSNWTPLEAKDDILEFLKDTPDFDNHLDPQHPLQEYACRYWVQHVNQCQEATGLSEILKRFLGTKGPQQASSRQYQAWCRHNRMRYGGFISAVIRDDVQPSEKFIFGICVFGLHKLLKGWWDKDIDVSQVNSMRLDLLAIAAKYGHDDLCSELIGRGSDIHKGLHSFHGSAFMEAIAMDQITTVRLLLDAGVDPNQVRTGRTPLWLAVNRNARHAAIAARHAAINARHAEDVVESLLKAGADPNTTWPDSRYVSALEAAAWDDQPDLAKLLMEYGADVNLADEESRYGSPLGVAAYRGSRQCAKLLVENGADINAHLGGRYGSVLVAAIFGKGGRGMVEYLIEEAGADPTILSSSPPRAPEGYEWLSASRKASAKYLLEAGHVQESTLLGIGFPREELP